MRRYTKDHEWLDLDGDIATVGITPYAQKQLGDLVFVELPAVGTMLAMGAIAATVESVKAASEVYSPVSGKVVAINEKLANEPGLVNSEPTGNGWLLKLKISDTTELTKLLDETTYNALTE
jgi:glycine cleavage system H protein